MGKIEEIKRRLPLPAFVARYTGGLKPSGQGRWFIGRCPFHQRADDPPNKRKFWVDADNGLCGCFVARCQAGRPPMDVINFYARLQGISNSQAIDDLAKELNIE